MVSLKGRWPEVRRLMRELAEREYMDAHHDVSPNPPTLRELREGGYLDMVKSRAMRIVAGTVGDPGGEDAEIEELHRRYERDSEGMQVPER